MTGIQNNIAFVWHVIGLLPPHRSVREGDVFNLFVCQPGGPGSIPWSCPGRGAAGGAIPDRTRNKGHLPHPRQDQGYPHPPEQMCGAGNMPLLLKLQNFLVNKKVLLRERKRHTASRIASARYAALSNGWGGTPPTIHPDLVREGGTLPHHPSRPGQGVPQVTPTIQSWDGVPPYPDLRWGILPPRPGMGYPPTQTLDGVPPPHLDLGRGTLPPPPPHPTSVDRLKILPSLILRMWAVNIMFNRYRFWNWILRVKFPKMELSSSHVFYHVYLQTCHIV